ncbi:MAG: TonB-dependent receptor, partial [Ginsengibacter sp.]
KEDFSVMTIGANGVKQYGNLSSAILAGVEANASMNILRSLNLSSANTYTKDTDHDGRALPLIAPFKTVNHLNYQLKKFVVDLNGIFSAAQSHVNTTLYGERKSQSYTILNTDIGYVFQFNKIAISLNIGLENMLNERYYDHTDIMKIPRVGRNLITHLTIAF